MMEEQDKVMRHLQFENDLLNSKIAEQSAQLVVADEKIWKYRVISVGLAGLSGLLGLGLLGAVAFKRKFN